MRKDILINVNSENNKFKIDNKILGITSENLQGKIIFKPEPFVDGVCRLYVDGKGSILMDKQEDCYTVNILSSLLTEDSLDICFKITEPEIEDGIPIFCSKIMHFRVLETIESSSTIPEDYPSWEQVLDSMMAKIEQMESDAEDRLDEVVGQIQDLTSAYNTNATNKTNAFNTNATNKTTAFNQNYATKVTEIDGAVSSAKSDLVDYTEEQKAEIEGSVDNLIAELDTHENIKEGELDSYTNTKKTELNTYTNTKKSELDDYEEDKEAELSSFASNKTSDFNSNASAKTTAFNNNVIDKTDDFDDNATSKTTAFNENATSKTGDFNTNATSKTTAYDENASTKLGAYNTNHTTKLAEYNSNATSKVSDYNTNASTKTSEFDQNASDKTDDFDDNATAKTTDFDNNATEKTTAYNDNATAKVNEFNENAESYEKRISELETERDEIAQQMPWNTTYISESIHIEDSAKYSRNKLGLFGNLVQEKRSGKNLIDFSNYVGKASTIEYSFTDDVAVATQKSAQSYAGVSFDILDTVKNNPSKELKFVYENLDVSNYTTANDIVIQIETTKNGNKGYRQMLYTDKRIYTYIIPDNTSDITSAILRIYTNNSATAIETSTVKITKPMLLFTDITDETYEKYGAMPSVDYPSMPVVATGVQKITKIGKNYWSANFNFEENGLKVTTDSSGLITVNGTPTQNISKHFIANKKIRYGKYIISVDRNLSNYKMLISIRNKENFLPFSNGLQTLSGVKTNVNITNTMYYQSIIFYEGYTYNNVQFRIQLEEGDSATEFEPYQEEKINLDLGETELCKITDSNGNVVAQDGIVYRNNKWQFEKNVEKIILNGTENWTVTQTGTDNWFYLFNNIFNKKLLTYKEGNKYAICNCLKANDIFTSNTKNGFFLSSNDSTHSYPFIRIRYGTEDTIENFKNWLSENNIVVYCILCESEYVDCTSAQSEVLDKLYKLNLQQGINNIFVESENGVTTELQLEYMQDLNSKLNQLEAMIVSNASEEVTE